jgi:aspartate kinase
MLIVQKYGGTSVGNIERIKAVAERVVASVKAGNRIVVVVSAMSGETDKLIGLAKQISAKPSERDMDVLLSSGERITTALTSMAISSFGQKAIALTGRQAGIITDSVHTKAKIERICPEKLLKSLDNGYCVVLAGFQGMTESGDVTTLGRGGSDLSAVAIAVAINADLCEIYTDVDGVYTTDPNIVPAARKLDKISFEEMLELASLGAKVLQTRSVEFACKYNLPIVVRSSFNNNPGTLVTKEDTDMEKVVVSGVAYDKNQAKLTIMNVPDKPGIAARIFTAVAGANIVVDVIVQNVSIDGSSADISFTVPKTETARAMEISERLAKDLGAKGVVVRDDLAKISIVGVGMRTHSGVAAEMFDTLAQHGVNIMAISTSEIKISCLIEAKYTELAVRVLHEHFGLDRAD